MQTLSRRCKAFEGECQCEAPATTEQSLRDLCDTHEEKFTYLKDLYHNKHEEYKALEPNKKLYFTTYSFFQSIENLSDTNGKFLLALHPEWIFEWDFEKNQNMSKIHELYSKSKKKLWWKCFCGYIYQKPPCARMNHKYPCKECAYAAARTREPDRIAARIIREKERMEGVLSPSAKGDLIEIYFEKLLQSTGIFKQVTRLGQFGGSSDIEIVLQNNRVRQLQIKKLTKHGKSRYYAGHMFKYVPNMLIAGANEDFTKFFIGFSKKFHSLRTSFSNDNVAFSFFNGRKGNKYEQFCYIKGYEDEDHDEKAFLARLIRDIPFSTNKNHMNESTRKEKESQERFSIFCEKRRLIYKRNTTNGTPIDGFVSLQKDSVEKSYSVQMKYVTTTKGDSLTSYSIEAMKSCGTGVYEPYHVKDGIDYFVVEIGGPRDNPHKFHNNFMIIPGNVMVEQEIFASEVSRGSQSFGIRAPDNLQEHWSMPYWNKIPDEWVIPPKFVKTIFSASYWNKMK